MKVTVHSLAKQAAAGEKIAMLTCYDASFAQLMDEAGVDMLLVGDSLGMVIQGQNSTLPVSLDDMLYHTRLVARGAQRAMVVADLPFGAYQQSPQQAFAASAALMAAGAQMVKLEGGAYMAPTVAFLVERGIPVCAHIGFTPQSVNTLGVRVQGRGEEGAERLLQDALALQAAGASLILMKWSLLPLPSKSHNSCQCLLSALVLVLAAVVRCWWCTTCLASIRVKKRALCVILWWIQVRFRPRLLLM